MRKIISLMLISAILISAIPVLSVSADTDAKCDEKLLSEASELLTAIGCADITAKKDRLITRDAWVNLMLQYSYYEGINKAELANSGIYSDTNYFFHPDGNIALGDAVVMLTKLLGYMPGVEYDRSVYINVANKLDLDDGINAAFDDNVTYEMAYVLLYNYLTANTAKLNITNDSVWVEGKGKSVLEGKFNITEVYGQISASQSYSLKKSEGEGIGFLTIDDIKCKNDRYDSDEYFAKYVTAYIRDYGKSNEIVALIEDDRTRVIELSETNSPSLQNNTVTYYDESGKERTKKISIYAQVFRNGEEVIYDEDNFVPQSGKITIIDNGLYSDGADTVVIENVIDIKVASVNKDSQKIYSEGLTPEAIPFDDELSLMTADGMTVKYEDLTSGDILSVWKKSDGSLLKAILCTKTVTGTITEVSGDRVFIDNQEFTLSQSRKSEFKDCVKPGSTVNAVINIYGQLADVKEETNVDKLCGILMQYSYKSKGLSESFIVKIYDSKDNFSSYEVSEKALVNGVRCKTYKEVEDALPFITVTDTDTNTNTDTKVLRQTLVLYELDENDKIISLEYSSDEIMDVSSGARLYLTGKTEKSEGTKGTGTYNRYFKYFGPGIFVEPSSTLMFRYPKQDSEGKISDEEDFYSVTNLNSVASGSVYDKCRITGYSVDENSKVARYITVEYELSSGSGNTVGSDTRVSMVGETKKCIWREENVEAVTIYNSKNPKGITIYGKDENYFTNLGIGSGDIIRVDYSSQTFIADAAELIWDNGATTLANGSYNYGQAGAICEARFCGVYKNWGVVSDVFSKSVDPATVSPDKLTPVRTDLYSVFRFNKKLGIVESLSYRDLVTYDAAGNDCSKIIYEMRYYDPFSMFVVE